MQSDDIDIVAALTSLLKTLQEMEKLTSKPLSQWATYSTTCAKFVKEASVTDTRAETNTNIISRVNNIRRRECLTLYRAV